MADKHNEQEWSIITHMPKYHTKPSLHTTNNKKSTDSQAQNQKRVHNIDQNNTHIPTQTKNPKTK